MKRERLGVAESTNALKVGKIDAYFWVGGLPTAAVTHLAATPGVKIKLVDTDDLTDKMNAKHGNLYSKGVIPAKTYPGQDKDNKIAGAVLDVTEQEPLPAGHPFWTTPNLLLTFHTSAMSYPEDMVR